MSSVIGLSGQKENLQNCSVCSFVLLPMVFLSIHFWPTDILLSLLGTEAYFRDFRDPPSAALLYGSWF